MDGTFPEKDWQILREMKKRLLQVQCEKALLRIRGILDRPAADSHATYLDVFKAVEEEDKKLGRMFDNPRRSTAIYTILAMVQCGLLTPEDLQKFSPNTRQKIGLLSGL